MPIPTTPSVFSESSTPVNFFFSHSPRFIEASAGATLRASASSIATACSAALVMFPSGVFITTTPLRDAAGTSTLSTPTPARPTTFRRSAASRMRAVTFVALRTTIAS